MSKKIYFIVFFTFFVARAFAQTDTAVFFYKYSGMRVLSQNDADYIRLVLPMDTTIDKQLFVVKDFYFNGKPKLLGKSISNFTPVMQGGFIEYFPNGKRRSVGMYENGKYTDVLIKYYPNGKMCSQTEYLKDQKYKLVECLDSTGKVLTENGTGHWVEFNFDYKKIAREGQVIKGVEEGEWHENRNDTINYITSYKHGKLISGTTILPGGKRYQFTAFDIPARFGKGDESMEYFFKYNARYPVSAKTNDKEGNVTVSFSIEDNGRLSNLKLISGIGFGCDDEVLRLVNLSALKWQPAYKDGIPCKSDFTCTYAFRVFHYKSETLQSDTYSINLTSFSITKN